MRGLQEERIVGIEAVARMIIERDDDGSFPLLVCFCSCDFPSGVFCLAFFLCMFLAPVIFSLLLLQIVPALCGGGSFQAYEGL